MKNLAHPDVHSAAPAPHDSLSPDQQQAEVSSASCGPVRDACQSTDSRLEDCHSSAETPSTVSRFSRPLSRRRFLARSAMAAAGVGLLGAPALARVSAKPTPIRAIAYNVLECKGWPSDKERALNVIEKGQMAKRFALELSLYDPDIIAFAESPDQSVTDEIARLMEMNVTYFPSGGYWPGTLFSRFEILDAENVPLVEGTRPEDLFTRHWGRATLRLSASETLTVYSAHLYPQNNPEGRALRKREIAEILKATRRDSQNGESILLIGDLNHTPDTPEYNLWMDAGWIDTHTAAGEGSGNTFRVDNPTRRIDYVMAYGPLAERVVSSRPLFEGAFRVNGEDPGSFALSDHLPVLAEFR